MHNPASEESKGQGTRKGMLTTRTNMFDPPEARATRAATGMARSARGEPSRGTRIRFNIIMLPGTTQKDYGVYFSFD